LDTAYNILTVLAAVIAAGFIVIVLITGKADAMSGGGGGVRTNFKGKASFEDFVNRILLALASAWVILVVALNVIAHQMS
jgi:preprotein translocase subunit SecG